MHTPEIANPRYQTFNSSHFLAKKILVSTYGGQRNQRHTVSQSYYIDRFYSPIKPRPSSGAISDWGKETSLTHRNNGAAERHRSQIQPTDPSLAHTIHGSSVLPVWSAPYYYYYSETNLDFRLIFVTVLSGSSIRSDCTIEYGFKDDLLTSAVFRTYYNSLVLTTNTNCTIDTLTGYVTNDPSSSSNARRVSYNQQFLTRLPKHHKKLWLLEILANYAGPQVQPPCGGLWILALNYIYPSTSGPIVTPFTIRFDREPFQNNAKTIIRAHFSTSRYYIYGSSERGYVHLSCILNSRTKRYPSDYLILSDPTTRNGLIRFIFQSGRQELWTTQTDLIPGILSVLASGTPATDSQSSTSLYNPYILWSAPQTETQTDLRSRIIISHSGAPTTYTKVQFFNFVLSSLLQAKAQTKTVVSTQTFLPISNTLKPTTTTQSILGQSLLISESASPTTETRVASKSSVWIPFSTTSTTESSITFQTAPVYAGIFLKPLLKTDANIEQLLTIQNFCVPATESNTISEPSLIANISNSAATETDSTAEGWTFNIVSTITAEQEQNASLQVSAPIATYSTAVQAKTTTLSPTEIDQQIQLFGIPITATTSIFGTDFIVSAMGITPITESSAMVIPTSKMTISVKPTTETESISESLWTLRAANLSVSYSDTHIDYRNFLTTGIMVETDTIVVSSPLLTDTVQYPALGWYKDQGTTYIFPWSQ